MINASGSSLPPVFIFPRIRYKDIILVNGLVGALGLANGSGWMNEKCFISQNVSSLQHFVNSTKENPALILMDNHIHVDPYG